MSTTLATPASLAARFSMSMLSFVEVATATEPIYDTATQIPADPARFAHPGQVQQPDRLPRVQVVWNRIILPDTSSLTADNLVGTDPAGYAGLEDDMDWHWDRISAGPVLTALLRVGAELAAPENRQEGNRVIIADATARRTP